MCEKEKLSIFIFRNVFSFAYPDTIMSSSVSNTSTMKDYNKGSTQIDISILTDQLEKQHNVDNIEIQGEYRWKPDRDTLGDLIREHEVLREILIPSLSLDLNK